MFFWAGVNLSRYRCCISLFRFLVPLSVIGGRLRLLDFALGGARACGGLRTTGVRAEDVASAAGSGSSASSSTMSPPMPVLRLKRVMVERICLFAGTNSW